MYRPTEKIPIPARKKRLLLAGMIPTHWMLPSAIEDGGDMWLNCMIETARMLSGLADYLDTVKK